ncbi:hypothetical protein AAZV13_15G194500 [Glycine max]
MQTLFLVCRLGQGSCGKSCFIKGWIPLAPNLIHTVFFFAYKSKNIGKERVVEWQNKFIQQKHGLSKAVLKHGWGIFILKYYQIQKKFRKMGQTNYFYVAVSKLCPAILSHILAISKPCPTVFFFKYKKHLDTFWICIRACRRSIGFLTHDTDAFSF